MSRLLCFIGRHDWWKVAQIGVGIPGNPVTKAVCMRCPAKRYR